MISTFVIDKQEFLAGWVRYGFELASNLRRERQEKGMTQWELSRVSGVARNTISNIERNEAVRGRPSDPTLSTVYRLAAALEISPSCLLPQPESILSGATFPNSLV